MDERICKKCGRLTPTEKLWNRRGWICNTCAAKHPRFRYRLYKARAVRAALPFMLSFEQFLEHWQRPCSYCGDGVETIGLDRVDNSRGYEPNNVVPCCDHCNSLKGAGNLDEFVARCVRITTLHPEVA